MRTLQQNKKVTLKSCDHKNATHPKELKLNMLNRLHRIEGQIRGISRMIDNDTYCDGILHQILAIESALDGVKKTLLEAHIKGCVLDQIQKGQNSVIDELLVTMKKMMK